LGFQVNEHTKGRGENRIKGLIFDLDGTLLNTLTSLANCYNRTLSAMGLPTHSVEDYRYFIGDGARQCVRRCLPEHDRTEQTIAETLHRQQMDYQTNWRKDVERYPGITELLLQLSSRNFPMGVLSNKDHAFTQQCVTYFFPEIRFNKVLGFSSEIPHKPDPTGALVIARHLNLKPDEIALVGDTSIDIKTAMACGMTGIGALWGFRDEAELVDAGATCVITHPDQLTQRKGLGITLD
jgi:phosphoglycolate phosphatase